MLLREKLLIGFCGCLVVIGVADLTTPHVNRFWERNIGFSGRFMIHQGGAIGYVNARSRLVIPPQFQDGVGYFDKDLAPVKFGGSWGYIDVNGQRVIPNKFATARKFQEGLAAVSIRTSSGHKFGFINADGEFAIEPKFAESGNFAEGLAPAKSAGVWGFINPQGEWRIAPQYEEARDFSEGLAAVKKDGQWGFVDQHGLFLIKAQFADVKSFREGLAPVKSGIHWGFINSKGEQIVEPQFISAGEFFDGLAVVNDSAYVNTQGITVIKPGRYINAQDFSEGLAAVQKYDKNKFKPVQWGYIDRSGEWVVEPRFELARDFHGGMARVSKDKNNTQRGYIHRDGRLTWDPEDWEQTQANKNFLKSLLIGFAVLLPFYMLYAMRERMKRFYFLQTIS